MKSLLLSFTLLIISSAGFSQYRTYETAHNEINQTVIQTADNGFLIAALEFCYTPDEWVIEGCPVGIHLIKTDALGDTVWTNEILNNHIQNFLHLFENRDGTYSLFASQNTVYTCKEWTIDPAFGLFQNVVYHLDENGNPISQNTFPNDCHEYLLSTIKISDTTFAMLTSYSEPFASDSVEGRLYRVNHEGTVFEMKVFPGQQLFKSDIAIDTFNHIHLFFVDSDSISRLHIYDQHLNLLEEYSNTNLNTPCLNAEGTRIMFLLPTNDQLFIMCDNQFGKGINTDMFATDSNLNIIGQKSYALPMIADITLNDEGEVMVVSQVRSEEDSSDIKLTYFSSLGDSLITRHFRIPGNQAPNDILALNGENFAIVGAHNCCNLSIDTGSGETFLYLAEQSTSTAESINEGQNVIIYPNPTSGFISIQTTDQIHDEIDVTIYSVSGEIVLHKKITAPKQISVEHLAEGYYLISIVQGGVRHMKKIVKV